MLYIAINLEDFHVNQKDAGTHCRMIFVRAKNIGNAKKHMSAWYPHCAWAIITKKMFDKNIAHTVDMPKNKD